jgi:hypothetical protein
MVPPTRIERVPQGLQPYVRTTLHHNGIIKSLKSVSMSLSFQVKMVGTVGFEPTKYHLIRVASSPFEYVPIMEAGQGLEPRSLGYEPKILPLDDPAIVYNWLREQESNLRP